MAATGTNADDGGVEERPPLTAAELTAFEQDPRNRVMYGDELQSDATEATMLCGFLNVNGCLNIYLRKNLILLGYLKLTCIGHLFLPWIIGMNGARQMGVSSHFHVL